MLGQKNIVAPTINDAEKRMILDGRVENYKTDMFGKPVPHLMLQIVTVKDVGEARCPEKGDGFTDDIFRAFVLWGAKLHDPKIMERLNEAKDWTYDGSRATMPMPASAGRSGGAFRGFRGLR
jgi:hypothetical protein